MKQNRMPRFMIGGDALIFVRNDLAPFLRSDTYLDKGFLDVFFYNKYPVIPGR